MNCLPPVPQGRSTLTQLNGAEIGPRMAPFSGCKVVGSRNSSAVPAGRFVAIIAATMFLAEIGLASEGRESTTQQGSISGELSNEPREQLSLGTLPPQTSVERSRPSTRVYRQSVEPHWIEGSDQFWYRNDLPEGRREFYRVDPGRGTREAVFDHKELERAFEALKQPSTEKIASLNQIHWIEFGAGEGSVYLMSDAVVYLWNDPEKSLSITSKEPAEFQTYSASRSSVRNRGSQTFLTIENGSEAEIELFWLSGGRRQSYGKIAAGEDRNQHTFGGHRWEIVNASGESLGILTAQDAGRVFKVSGAPFTDPYTPPPSTEGQRERRGTPIANHVSPDGRHRFELQNGNVVIYEVESESVLLQSQDADDDHTYGLTAWSPASDTLVSFRVRQVTKKPFHIVRSSPPDGGRALLESHPYSLPGDPLPVCEVTVFDVGKKQIFKPAVDPFEHEWERPSVKFLKSRNCVVYSQVDRGHGRFRLVEIDLQNGEVRNLIDEKADTFIWSAHSDFGITSRVHWIGDEKKILYVTEKYGWRQLVLLDGQTGAELSRLTPEGIVLRSIERIDEENNKIWFTACGRDGQDPYHIHYGTVSIDSGELVWLTEGDGMHDVKYSPSGEFLIDTYSRVDLAPVTELRRVADGELVLELERSDTSDLEASGWQPEEVFSAKGRDGITDIWGIICRPADFDPTKKYPVIENIYAGPHGSFVPKHFSSVRRNAELTKLGFIVVQIDGMGTANRSKAFQDVCWKNLKDGGFEDRIAWMRAAGEKYSELDLDRVGIYGVSAGGQNAAAAVLFHPEFYKAAVAGCGCHDNRMDKASWNEQWMGYPVGPHYSASSNIDNAYRLEGDLMLIVGEVDTNVPPESTLRFADALIRADKNFDLIVVPNAGHGIGGRYGERRMREFFLQHLQSP